MNNNELFFMILCKICYHDDDDDDDDDGDTNNYYRIPLRARIGWCFKPSKRLRPMQSGIHEMVNKSLIFLWIINHYD